MDENKKNAIARARLARGLTQEALAEAINYSADAVRCWEGGARTATIEALDLMATVLGAPWLPGLYMRERTTALDALLPEFRVGRPVSEAAADFICRVMELTDQRFDRALLRMVADGKIDELERGQFEQLLFAAEKINKAFYELRFAAGQGKEAATCRK